MLQIRLNKGSSSDSGTGVKSLPPETVTVACPEHLVLADLPVAKGLGSATAASTVKILGRRSRRQLTERVHFCVHCDFPIAIYGRLSPCEHAFCLDCARSDSICYICDERIQKIQTIKMMEGIFICAAPHCLKSFLKKPEFEAHVYRSHADLLRPNMRKEEMNEPQESGTKQSSTLDSTLRGPPRPAFPSSSNPQLNDREDKSRRQQPPAMPVVQPKPPQYYGQPHLPEPQPNSRPMGIDGLGHNLDAHGGMQQEYGQSSDKQQQGMLPDPHCGYPPIYPQQQPHFQMPNPMLLASPPFGFPPFAADGVPPFYGAPVLHEVARSDSSAEAVLEQGSVLGFAPTPGGGVSFPEGYSHPWSGGPGNIPFDAIQSGQGILTAAQPQTMPPPPPPPGPPPPHLLQHKRGQYSGEMTNDGNNY